MAEEKILKQVKSQIGIGEDCQDYDSDLILLINSAFATLNQLGAGPKEGFSITGDSEEWNQFSEGLEINFVKQYVYLKTKLAFDPSNSSFALESTKKQIDELEFRISVEVDPGKENSNE